MKHHLLAPLTLALALGLSTPSGWAQTEPAPVSLDWIKAQTERGLAGIRRVAIPTFIVQLVRDEGIEREGGSGGMFAKQSATYFVQNRGIDATQLEALANTLYDAFVQDLAAVGVSVVPIAEMDANEDMQAIRSAARTSPQVIDFERGVGKKKVMSVNLLASAKGLPIVARHTADERWLPPSANRGEAMKGLTFVLGPAKAASALKAPLINVRLTISTIVPKGSGHGNSSYSRWEFSCDAAPRFVEGGTAVMLSDAQLSGSPEAHVMRLTQAVPIGGIELKGAAGEGGNARGSGLLGALSRATGGADTQSADAYVDIDPASFAKQAGEQGRRVLRGFIESMTGQQPR